MQYTEKKGAFYLNKPEVDANIKAKKFIGINKIPRNEHIIISLTSFPRRINSVKYAIYSLLNQNFPADMVILWLATEEFPQREKNLPQDLLEMIPHGLTVKWCENLKSYKKLIPTLQEYPDSVTVTADDDIYYPPDWLKILYDEHINFPECIIAHRFHRVRMDVAGNIFPYHEWAQLSLFSSNATPPLFWNAFTTGGGVLLLKKFLHSDVMNRENFMQLAPHNDDIWFWAMAILNGTKIKIPEKAIPNILSVDENARNEYALWTLNKQGRSHFQLLQVFKKYPNTHNILIQEIANFKPYISVVIIIKNTDKVLNCINNLIFNQFADYEVLIINTGTRANTAKLPYNFKFINFSGASINSARNLGLSKARGKLILFKEDNNFFITGALANIVRLDSNFNAEIIHCSAHFQTEQNKFQRIADDDTGNIGKDTFVFANENKQLRAVQWFNNKLSRRLDTKIFKRNFLLENNFKFNEGDESEFIFSCLIKAEKYLLTSQAFLYF